MTEPKKGTTRYAQKPDLHKTRRQKKGAPMVAARTTELRSQVEALIQKNNTRMRKVNTHEQLQSDQNRQVEKLKRQLAEANKETKAAKKAAKGDVRGANLRTDLHEKNHLRWCWAIAKAMGKTKQWLLKAGHTPPGRLGYSWY